MSRDPTDKDAMDDDRTAIRLVSEAHERTRATASARFELSLDDSWETPGMPKLRPGSAVAWAVGKRLFKAVTRNVDFRRPIGEGVIDFRRRRYMLDFGSYAKLYADGKHWHGRSGRELSTLSPNYRELPTPLWLFDLLSGLTAASDQGIQAVRGMPCRCLAATVDISRASERTPGGVGVPRLGRFEELLAFPLEVCVDGKHVRRVRRRYERSTETLVLWDFGVSLADFDWSRLPTIKSPKEAEAVAKAREGG